MYNHQVFNRSLKFILILSIGMMACSEKEIPDYLKVRTGEFLHGVYVVEAIGYTTNFRINLDQAADFYPSESMNPIAVDLKGVVDLKAPFKGVFWVEVEKTSGGPRMNLPVLITETPEESKNVIRQIVAYNNQPLAFFLRHVEAFDGMDNLNSQVENWWKSCDPQVARQASDSGKLQGKKIGEAIRKLNLPVNRGLSSEFCRAVQSIEFMELELPIAQHRILNHVNYNPDPNNFVKAVDLVKGEATTGEFLIVVGHSNLSYQNPYIQLITSFQMGDGFLMIKNQQGNMDFVGSVPIDLWDAFIHSDFIIQNSNTAMN